MQIRVCLLVSLVFFASSAFAKDVFLAVGGSVGTFRTDTRIFNPSYDKDITVSAYLNQIGSVANHPDNSGVAPRTITVSKRSMVVFDDVLTSLFQTSGLASIRLSSADDFTASQRAYSSVGLDTFGQFVAPVDGTATKKKGVLIQLKNTGSGGTRGTFRTNVGFVNTNAVAANVTARLYDKNNALVGAPKVFVMQPFGATRPESFADLFAVGAADLSNAWLSYESDQPMFAYASVLDNGTQDAITVLSIEDTGVAPTTQPPTQASYDVQLEDFSISISPQPGSPAIDALKTGDVVTLRISNDGLHGFQLLSPNGVELVTASPPNGGTVLRTFTVTEQGTYGYFCTNTLCSGGGSGHTAMLGTFTVGPRENPGGPGRDY